MRLHHYLRFLPLVFILALGCGDGGSAGGQAAAKGAGKAGKKNRSKSKQRLTPGQGAAAAGASFSKRTDIPFTEIRGYVVKGTDESSFRRCGSSKVYLARVAPQTASRFAQHYRWSARGLLDPVYIVAMGRFVDDTASVGPNRYTAVVEIRDLFIERSKETPACPAPRAGSMLGTR